MIRQLIQTSLKTTYRAPLLTKNFSTVPVLLKGPNKNVTRAVQAEDSTPNFGISSGQVKFSGRSVPVKDSNPQKAYVTLNSILTQSGLRQTLKHKRYYEKPSVKRRRLRMEGNRKRFKDAVAKKVALVLQMKNR
jgi:ribosomal protein S21